MANTTEQALNKIAAQLRRAGANVPAPVAQAKLHMRDPLTTAAMLVNEWNEAPQDTDDWGNRAAEAINYLASELHKQIVASVQAERHVLTDDAWSIGYSMSNVMFNLAQQAGHVLDGDDCATFDKLRKHWDAAASTAPQVEQVEAKEGWISVKDRLPPPCTMVLAWIPQREDKAKVYYISTHPKECVEEDGITDWMLITAPSSQKE